MRKICGIYKITSPTRNIYVGQSVFIHKRLLKYKSLQCISQPRLYNSLKKYGFDNHTIEILEECDRKDLNDRERYYQDLYNCVKDKGLNCELTNNINNSKELSKETKLKISRAHIGKEHTDIAKLNMSIAQRKIRTKKVIDITTGIIYESHYDAADKFNIKHKTLYSKLAGYRINNTQLKYYETI